MSARSVNDEAVVALSGSIRALCKSLALVLDGANAGSAAEVLELNKPFSGLLAQAEARAGRSRAPSDRSEACRRSGNLGPAAPEKPGNRGCSAELPPAAEDFPTENTATEEEEDSARVAAASGLTEAARLAVMTYAQEMRRERRASTAAARRGSTPGRRASGKLRSSMKRAPGRRASGAKTGEERRGSSQSPKPKRRTSSGRSSIIRRAGGTLINRLVVKRKEAEDRAERKPAEAKEPAELAAVARPSLAKRVQQEEAPAPTRRSGFFGAGPSRVSPGLMLSENEFDDIFERAQDAREFIAALAPTGLLMVRELAILYVVVMLPVFLCFRGPRRWPWGLAAANFLVELSCVCDWRAPARKIKVREREKERREKAKADDGEGIDVDEVSEGALFWYEMAAHVPCWTVKVVAERAGSYAAARVLGGLQAVKLLEVGRFVRTLAASGSDAPPTILRGLRVDPIVYRILKLVCSFVMVLHYLACGYHRVGRRWGADAGADGGVDWAYYARRGPGRTLAWQWAQAYYWATMSALGNYMQPVGAARSVKINRCSAAQTSFSTAGCLVGIFMTATITGSVTSLLANADVVASQHREKRSRMRAYLKQNHVPASLSDSIHAYYDYLWQSSSLTDDDLFKDLTETLKLKLALAVKRRFILSCPLFKSLNPFAVINLVQRLEHRIAVPDQVIMAEGEHGDTMYFCVRGRMAVSIRDRSTQRVLKVAELKTGDYFGEAALITGEPRTANVTAITFCETYMLNKAAFAAARKENAEFCVAVESQVRRRDVRNAYAVKLRRVRNALIAVTAFANTPASRAKKALLQRQSQRQQSGLSMRGSGKFSFRRLTSMGRSASTRQSSSNFLGRTLSGFSTTGKAGRLAHEGSSTRLNTETVLEERGRASIVAEHNEDDEDDDRGRRILGIVGPPAHDARAPSPTR